MERPIFGPAALLFVALASQALQVGRPERTCASRTAVSPQRRCALPHALASQARHESVAQKKRSLSRFVVPPAQISGRAICCYLRDDFPGRHMNIERQQIQREPTSGGCASAVR
jgi:hypothetical protein